MMSQNNKNRVLVLGAYGLAGRTVVQGLLKKSELRIIISGRNKEKLQQIRDHANSPERLETAVFDALDTARLKSASAEAGLVINCVGPYSMSGFEIARTVLETSTHYIDFANEQIHYSRLKELAPFASRKNLMLLTACGWAPGFSTLLMKRAVEKVPSIHSLEMCYVQGRTPDDNSGMGSIMGAILEPGFGSVTLKNGELIQEKLGVDQKLVLMPEPFGETAMLGIPTIDTLLFADYPGLRDLRTYFAVGVQSPPGLFSLIGMLKAHKRKWAYRLLERIVSHIVRKSYADAVKKGFTPGGYIQITAKSRNMTLQNLIPFEDGGTATSYLPVLAARRLFQNKIQKTGLLTVLELFNLDTVLNECRHLGWPIQIEENITKNQNR